MAYLETDRGKFYFEEAGAGAPLLLIHCNAGRAAIWRDVMSPLSADWRVFAHDRRGFGLTQGEPPAQDLYGAHADDAAALLRGCNATPAAVVGWSNGGLIALQLAMRHPEIVSQLVLVEPPFQVLKNADPTLMKTFGEIERHVKSNEHRTAAELFLRWAFQYKSGGSAWDMTLTTDTKNLMLERPGAVLHEVFRGGSGDDITPDGLARIACPVTCLVGDRSPEVSSRSVERIVAAVKRGRVAHVPGVGHAMHLDNATNFLTALRSALDRSS